MMKENLKVENEVVELKEFQLTELEVRLEMAAIEPGALYICCNCLPYSYCV